MKNRVQVSRLIKDATSLWNYLSEQAGLDTKKYDADIVHEVRARLSLPPKGDLGVLLGEENISTEDLILAFFQSVQPYAEMMSDILHMFEKAGAKQSNKNLAVHFVFGREIPELGFDLSRFRSWLETWRKVTGAYLVNRWHFDTIWALNGALRGRDSEVRDPNMQRWLHKYMAEKTWPDFFPSAPCSGDQQLDEALVRAWRVWERVVRESAKFGPDRGALRKIASQQREKSHAESETEGYQGEWSPAFLQNIDSDHWAGSLAQGAFHKAERIATLSSPQRLREANELRNRLDRVFNEVPVVQIEGESLVRHVEEFLNLPIWQRRHELYSVWVGAQILDALEAKATRIHQVDGAILYSFSGTHLATADAFEPRLHVWAELRSPLASPIGRGRKRAIQPDYSLITDPITNPEASVIEVECKQYLRPSARNFSAALTDYARGRPNAHVLLVNYGPADASILKKVDRSVRHRTSLIGNMRPGSIMAQEQFKRIINRLLSHRFGAIAEKKRGQVNLANKGQITLSWDALPCDLDLHLRIQDGDNDYGLWYSQKGAISERPWAKLDEDIQTGRGPETIEVVRWVDGRYHFAVHNYSNDSSLVGCGASVRFVCGQQSWQFRCPEEGTGRWWSVFVLHAKAGELEVVNKIVERLWD